MQAKILSERTMPVFYEVKSGALICEKSDKIGVPHGFSTRFGGVSRLPHLASLNLGENRGDDPENVAENISRFLEPMGYDRDSAVLGVQVHSLNVRAVTPADGGTMFEDTDGFVANRPGVALIVKIADCVPILLWEPDAGVIGALHAGWRGSGGAIAAAGVSRMRELGADPKNIRAAIGACIHDCCYEVRSDFVQALTDLAGSGPANSCLSQRNGRIYADLPGLNRRILMESGLREDNIDINPACTCCSPARYFSHRASGGLRGTMGAAIALQR